MASIKRRELPDGSVRWDVRYRANGGSHRETFDREKAARERRAAVEGQLARSGGTWTPPTKVTFRDAAEAWFERKQPTIRPATRTQYRSALNAHLLPAFGSRLTVTIKPSDVKTFRDGLASDGKSASTVGTATTVLSMILGELVFDGQLPANPVDALPRGKRPSRPTRKYRAPTDEQVDALLAALETEEDRAVLELLALTGMRRSELFRAAWADVEFEAREIHVLDSKTDAGVRDVPMFGSARRILLEQKARSRFTQPQHPVFATVVGTQRSARSWHDRVYRRAREKAGLPEVRLHGLRRYAVSKLIEQGADVLVVAAIAGHKDPSITLRVRRDLFDKRRAEAAVRFDPRRAISVSSGGLRGRQRP